MPENNANFSSENNTLNDASAEILPESVQATPVQATPVQATPVPIPSVQPVPISLVSTTAANTGVVVDFLSSARRHLRDGNYLEDNGYIENAGQLYGFVAECGLKALFILLGQYPIDNRGSPVRSTPNLRNHIDGILPLLTNLDVFCSGRTSVYLSMLSNINDFHDWSVDHRYYNSACIPQSLSKWKQSANEVAAMLQQATLDGVL